MQEGCEESGLLKQAACMVGGLRSKHIEMERRSRGIEMTVFVTRMDLCEVLKVYRGIVQLVERWSPKPNVEGSSPSTPALKIFRNGWNY